MECYDLQCTRSDSYHVCSSRHLAWLPAAAVGLFCVPLMILNAVLLGQDDAKLITLLILMLDELCTCLSYTNTDQYMYRVSCLLYMHHQCAYMQQ
jgi:hypothetical protein